MNSTGPRSAWSQQRSHLLKNGVTTCPRKPFLLHLHEELQAWTAKGELIILAGDFNDDVRQGPVPESLYSLGLREVITTTHGSNGPSTFERGSMPVDGIFVSPQLLSSRCGYLECWKDHRCLWLEISIEQFLGTTVAPIIRPHMRRLKLHDPRVEDNYLKSLESWYHEFDLLSRSQMLLDKAMDRMLDKELSSEWEAIQGLIYQGSLMAEEGCRGVFTGNVSWSPTLRQSQQQLLFWKLMLKRSNWGSVDSRYLSRKAKAAGFSQPWRLVSRDTVLREYKAAVANYKTIKNQAADIRENFLRNLAEVRANANKQDVAAEIKRIIQTERVQL